jgi:hypothetical protein
VKQWHDSRRLVDALAERYNDAIMRYRQAREWARQALPHGRGSACSDSEPRS